MVKVLCSEAKSDIIKVHITIDIDEYIHLDHPIYNWVKSKSFSIDQWKEIIQIIRNYPNKELMVLVNDTSAVAFSSEFNPEYVEIHSTCLNDLNLLKKVNDYFPSTKIVIGVGGSDLYSIENAIDTLSSNVIVLMHGFQNYPTKYEDINLKKIKRIQQLFPNYQHGYADHTAWDSKENEFISLLGASQNMSYLEKHVTTAYGEERADWQAAISIEMFNSLSDKLSIIKNCMGNGLLKFNAGEKSYSVYGPMKKAAMYKNNLKKGHVLTEDDFLFKRTAQTTNMSQLDTLQTIGKTLIVDVNQFDVLRTEHLN